MSLVTFSHDAPTIAAHKWCAIPAHRGTFYAVRSVDGRLVYMHREILGLPRARRPQVDHRDHDGLNNRRENLRLATSSQNLANSRKPHRGTNRYKGVTRCERMGKWKVQIRIDGRYRFLGYFVDEREGAQAYDAAALAHFGEFAATNLP